MLPTPGVEQGFCCNLYGFPSMELKWKSSEGSAVTINGDHHKSGPYDMLVFSVTFVHCKAGVSKINSYLSCVTVSKIKHRTLVFRYVILIRYF